MAGMTVLKDRPFFLHCCINLQHHLAYVNQPQTLVDTEGVATWQ
jgi:hypothetical protein